MRRAGTFIVLLLIAFISHAQNFHITGFLGAANYQGDLQDKKYTFNQAQFAYGLGLKYDLSPNFTARLSLTMGKVGADDKKGEKITTRDRNLNFTSSITDVTLGLEYDLFNLDQNMITPYIFAGVTAYHFDPYTHDTSGKVYLQPLGTEGQGFYQGRKKYNLNQLAIPIGGGLKWAVNDNLHIGFEIGLRKLFTDYLDDVSSAYPNGTQLLAFNGPKAVALSYREDELKPSLGYPTEGTIRGSPKNKDWYYFTGVTVSIRIITGDGSGGRNKKYGCPSQIN